MGSEVPNRGKSTAVGKRTQEIALCVCSTQRDAGNKLLRSYSELSGSSEADPHKNSRWKSTRIMSEFRVKYPRTPHLPWSPGKTRDDRTIESLECLTNTSILVTEKLDGSNVCMTQDAVYSRGGDANHPSFNWLKAWHATHRYAIPRFSFAYAEYCYAVHSISYDTLPHYLHLFAVLDAEDSTWLSWKEVTKLAAALNIPTVPTISSLFAHNEKELEETTREIMDSGTSVYGPTREGLVLRDSSQIKQEEFGVKVAKWVRKDHVQTDEHWMHKPIVQQHLEVKNA